MTSKSMRENPLFTRNSFEITGKWDIPLIKNQPLQSNSIMLVACSDTRTNDTSINCQKGVHFFVDDYRFSGLYNNPEKSFARYSQYAFLLSPDYSTYADMPLWLQMENVAKNRWIGAYWQSRGKTVYPTISWGEARSFEFCFDGAEQNGIVAVGMIGCKQSRLSYMRGYDAMLEHLQPNAIIVFGTPFSEMRGNIIPIDYISSRKVGR